MLRFNDISGIQPGNGANFFHTMYNSIVRFLSNGSKPQHEYAMCRPFRNDRLAWSRGLDKSFSRAIGFYNHHAMEV